MHKTSQTNRRKPERLNLFTFLSSNPMWIQCPIQNETMEMAGQGPAAEASAFRSAAPIRRIAAGVFGLQKPEQILTRVLASANPPPDRPFCRRDWTRKSHQIPFQIRFSDHFYHHHFFYNFRTSFYIDLGTKLEPNLELKAIQNRIWSSSFRGPKLD